LLRQEGEYQKKKSKKKVLFGSFFTSAFVVDQE